MSQVGFRRSKKICPLRPNQITSPPSSTKINSMVIRSTCWGLSILSRDLCAVLCALCSFFALLYAFDAHFLQRHRRAWTVARIARQFGNFVRHVLPLHHFTENGVLVVQPRRRRYSDKKLAAIGARPRVGHRQFARFRVLQRGVKFIAKSVARAPTAVAARTASLNHKNWNHAMKRQSVVVVSLLFFSGHLIGKFFRAFGKSNEIRHRFRGFFLQQSNDNVALRSFKYRVCPCGSAHEFSSHFIVHEPPQASPPRPKRGWLAA